MSNPQKPASRQGVSKQYCRILAGQLYDSHWRILVPNQAVTVDKQIGVIVDVRDISSEQATGTDRDSMMEVIDLRHLVVLPGFVDAHVHMFLHQYSQVSWRDQLTKESLPERTLRAGMHAWKTLQAGFTTVRDLGTEGAFDADIALRKCLACDMPEKEPIVHGPRYYCASRAIVATGSYGPKNEINPSADGVEGIMGAEVADGEGACIRAVRRQIGAGADWIKIYADYRVRSNMADVSSAISGQSIRIFSNGELEAMIDAAHARGVKVAAHAQTPHVMQDLLNLGVDTIEHGTNMDDNVVQQLSQAAGRTIWVPTLAAFYTLAEDPNATEETRAMWRRSKENFIKVAVMPEQGGGARVDNIACGGDTGVFAHGQNALELMLMTALGAEWQRVLCWATLGGWLCVRGKEWEGEEGKKRLAEAENAPDAMNGSSKVLGLERGVPFGALKKGWAADIIGLNGKVDGDFGEFSKAIMDVEFVMKGGRVYRQDRFYHSVGHATNKECIIFFRLVAIPPTWNIYTSQVP